MIELPEAAVLARQVIETMRGKRISDIVVAHTPHKLVWYTGDPHAYCRLLRGRTIDGAASYGGKVEVAAGEARMLFSDGVNLRYFKKGEKPPDRHQLLLVLDDGSTLVGSVQMYGDLCAFPEGKYDNRYYLTAKQKPSPLTALFDEAHFDTLFGEGSAKLSLKAFLATEQRIPGLGNGVLQDILFNAQMHPKRKVKSMSPADRRRLFDAIKSTLTAMLAGGGRDTETDLLGRTGGYVTKLSRSTAGQPCPVCGGPITKEAYLGGSIYFCAACQKLQVHSRTSVRTASITREANLRWNAQSVRAPVRRPRVTVNHNAGSTPVAAVVSELVLNGTGRLQQQDGHDSAKHRQTGYDGERDIVAA